MMRARPLRAVRLLGLLVLLGLALVAVTACGGLRQASEQAVIKVSMLIQSSEQDAKWFRNVEVKKGTNAYELTEVVTNGNIQADYNAAYRSHFVNAILGVENNPPNFWLIYAWSEPQGKWEPLPVGADLYSLKEGHILAWYYADITKEGAVPTAIP